MRRRPLTAFVSVAVLCAISADGRLATAEETAADARMVCGGGILEVNLPGLVASADLNLTGPVPRSEAGMPIGNGRMGTLLWTSPTTLHMQINRVDVFGNNKDSNSFPQRYTDYCGGCAFVDIDAGGEVFGDEMTQHLSCSDGLATVAGAGVESSGAGVDE